MLNTYLLKPRWVHLLALATLVLGGTAQAQISTTYTFLQGSRVYAPIATPDSTVGMSGEDDAEYNNIPIKMPFNFNGQTFTRLGISSNAYLVLGSGPLDGTISQVLDRGEDNVIALFDADLENQNPLSLKWDGTAPNRSFTIEYVNSRRLSTNGDVINAQIILRENGAIELSYGRIVAAPGSSDRDMQVGIRGNRGDVIALEGFFPNFTTTNTSTATVAYGPSSIPANGLG